MRTLEVILGIDLFDRSGKMPVLTDAGRVLLDDAHRLVENAETLRSRAASISTDLEPELTLVVDGGFPQGPLLASLKAVSLEFPQLPVTLFTEYLSNTEQRLKDGSARLGLYPALSFGAGGYETEFLTQIQIVHVVSVNHPLAAEKGPISKGQFRHHVQLILAESERTRLQTAFPGIVSDHVWRIADLFMRRDLLIAGFGWATMPFHLVEAEVAAGRLKLLEVKELNAVKHPMPVHAVYAPGRSPGRAGRFLIDDLKHRLGEHEY